MKSFLHFTFILRRIFPSFSPIPLTFNVQQMATPNSGPKMSSDFELPTGNGNYGMAVVLSFIPDIAIVISAMIMRAAYPLALHGPCSLILGPL